MALMKTQPNPYAPNLQPVDGLLDDPSLLDTYRVVLENITMVPNRNESNDLRVALMGVHAPGDHMAPPQKISFPPNFSPTACKNMMLGKEWYWSLGWNELSTFGCQRIINALVRKAYVPQLLCVREQAYVWHTLEPWMHAEYRPCFSTEPRVCRTRLGA